MKTRLLALTALAGLLMSTGAVVLWVFHLPAHDRLRHMVPAEAAAYVHVFLRPSTQQRINLRDLLDRLPFDLRDSEDLKAALGRLLDPALATVGMSYARDVSPWLGDEMAYFALPDGGQAVMLTVAQGHLQAARRAAETVTAATPDVAFREFDDVVVVGDGSAVGAVMDLVGSPEGGRAVPDEVFEDLPRDRTLTVYASGDGEVGAVAAAGIALPTGLRFDLVSSDAPLTEVRPGEIADLIGRLDVAGILPFEAFGRFLSDLDRSGPVVLAALRVAGVLRPAVEGEGVPLGEGAEAQFVLDAERMEALSGPIDLGLGSGGVPASIVDAAGYISHIVLGTHPNGAIRIAIGVR